MVSVLAVTPVGVYMTKHEAVPVVVVPPTSVHDEPVNEPRVPASLVKPTFPPGVTAVPSPEESVTVAVHVVADPVLTDAGRHVRVVAVGRGTTVRCTVAPEGAWSTSPE